ncbi:MFS transporter [Nocardia arthritidis]|uniref:MFS transporter n=1 Tax=Nocardia arthritidis TaxID=228602 RepID=A0A6G9YNH8_9NOCA|nr:MFS transporter [Nocardia arthritidis]
MAVADSRRRSTAHAAELACVSTTLASPPIASTDRSPLLCWSGVAAVMLGIFAIVTTEMLPVGLLTSIAGDFTISDGMAGLMMTVPGLVAAAAAPVVTVATARVDRRIMLCLFIFLLIVADLLMAVTPVYWPVLAARVLVGVTVGGFWSIAAGLADRLVPAKSVPRANAIIFAAVPLGSVLGVPAGTYLGDLTGWRVAFAVVAGFTVAVLGLLLAVLPPLPGGPGTRVSLLRSLVRGTNMRYALLLTFLIVLAHFGAYTYITPFLEQVTKAGSATVTLMLLAYGVAGIVGNFLGGAAVARHPRGAFAGFVTMIIAALLLLPVLGRWEFGALALLLVWGVGYGAVPVATQTWFIKAAPNTPEAASVLFTASFQLTLSLGALTGGVIVDHTSPTTVLLLAAAPVALAILTLTTHLATGRVWPDLPRT